MFGTSCIEYACLFDVDVYLWIKVHRVNCASYHYFYLFEITFTSKTVVCKYEKINRCANVFNKEFLLTTIYSQVVFIILNMTVLMLICYMSLLLWTGSTSATCVTYSNACQAHCWMTLWFYPFIRRTIVEECVTCLFLWWNMELCFIVILY